MRISRWPGIKGISRAGAPFGVRACETASTGGTGSPGAGVGHGAGLPAQGAGFLPQHHGLLRALGVLKGKRENLSGNATLQALYAEHGGLARLGQASQQAGLRRVGSKMTGSRAKARGPILGGSDAACLPAGRERSSVMKRYMGWDIDFLSPQGESAYASPDSCSGASTRIPWPWRWAAFVRYCLSSPIRAFAAAFGIHSVFPKDPLGRGQRTAMAAQIGVFGPRSAADQVIDRIGRLHARVAGETPGGRAYRASDPELANWVSATASYGFVMAYHRFVARLSAEEIDPFLPMRSPWGGSTAPPIPLGAWGLFTPSATPWLKGSRPTRSTKSFWTLCARGGRRRGASLASGANGRGLHLPVACGGSRSFGPWARLRPNAFGSLCRAPGGAPR